MHLIQLQGIYDVHADFVAFGRRSHSNLLLERYYDYKISYGNEAYSSLPHIQLTSSENFSQTSPVTSL